MLCEICNGPHTSFCLQVPHLLYIHLSIEIHYLWVFLISCYSIQG